MKPLSDEMLISEVAERIHAADNSVTASYVASQARWLIAKGLIEPVGRRGGGRNARALLDATAMCRVKVFTTLVRLGMVPEMIAAVPRLLENIADDPKPNKVEPVGFRRVVEGIEKGEKGWTFHLHTMADGEHRGACSRKPLKPNPLRDNLRIATVQLPLNNLLGPLLKD